jgi:catechol 2,3-dioxygenase-like lactoylglutathione lyase family enzyme
MDAPRGPARDDWVTVLRVVANLQGDDPQAARELFVDVLGLEVAMDQGWIVTYAAPAPGATARPQVSVISDDATGPVVAALSVEVDDVDAAHGRAVERGFEIVHPLTDEPWGVRRFFVRDRGGTVVNVLQHAR